MSVCVYTFWWFSGEYECVFSVPAALLDWLFCLFFYSTLFLTNLAFNKFFLLIIIIIFLLKLIIIIIIIEIYSIITLFFLILRVFFIHFEKPFMNQNKVEYLLYCFGNITNYIHSIYLLTSFQNSCLLLKKNIFFIIFC